MHHSFSIYSLSSSLTPNNNSNFLRKKTDPNGDYIRKWLPQFKTMPSKFIYEPWTAPIEVQRRCGVVVGVNYPHPIVDHAVISKSNMARMKAAYDAHNRGEANNGGGGGR
jgi:cryptochrome